MTINLWIGEGEAREGAERNRPRELLQPQRLLAHPPPPVKIPGIPGAASKPGASAVASATTSATALKFELLDATSLSASDVSLAKSSVSQGSRFSIDLTSTTKPFSPATSPHDSGDFGHGWPFSCFVMSSRVEHEGKPSCPTVEVDVAHVACAEDAAAFVALIVLFNKLC
ncbi:hypothetical protein J5N97_020033 [Dioscorea zingiberensis]|uniref:Uncharacterized protein n=1 Tax=Dioscorea zingiberensis TaxID=325984 RepID=A0A9D5CFV6_9LILI|nr:hypothetical protein J5N97_020033 [Dioscorea zingiberensis]